MAISCRNYVQLYRGQMRCLRPFSNLTGGEWFLICHLTPNLLLRIKYRYPIFAAKWEKCAGKVRVVACIEEPEVIEKILKRTGLDQASPTRNRAPPIWLFGHRGQLFYRQSSLMAVGLAGSRETITSSLELILLSWLKAMSRWGFPENSHYEKYWSDTDTFRHRHFSTQTLFDTDTFRHRHFSTQTHGNL